MNLTLKRKEKRAEGIFSVLLDESGKQIAATLEHAYQNPDGSWSPKITDGVHLCIVGNHRLHGMTEDFQTYEITGVFGHSNLLFHWGNYNKDSEGCILLGENETGDMVTNSRATFAKFIALQSGLNSFMLTVE